MHIPDGFVSGPINGATTAISAGAVGVSLWRVKREIRDKPFAMPLLATTAAFVFAAQMLNFPIGGGTSGHFLGAATVAALLGPWSACLVLTAVLVTQGLLFGDGGISALGSNIFNMGIVGGLAGCAIMRTLRSMLPAGRGGYLASAAVASWLGVVLASAACSFELALSGTSSLGVALPAMVGTHAIIGIGKALICVAVLSAVAASRPDVVPAWANLDAKDSGAAKVRKSVWALAGTGLALAVALAVFGSPFASESPDGLEKIAADKGFEAAASEDKVVWTRSPFSDYKIGAVKSEKVSTGLAGLIGTVIVFGLGFAAIRAVSAGRGEGSGS